MRTWAEVNVGDSADPKVDGPLTVTDFVRYQGASGDMNPIHHDSEYAVRAGFDQPFAVGMRQAGVLGTFIAETWGPESVRSLTVRFRSQAWPGDVLTYSAVVTAKREGESGRVVDLELAVTRRDGSVHISGHATVALG